MPARPLTRTDSEPVLQTGYRKSRKLSVFGESISATKNPIRKLSVIFSSEQGRKLSGKWSHKRAGQTKGSIYSTVEES